jgi:uncharacterized membrane protein
VFAQAVHTTGINWASVLTIICAVVGALALIFGVITRFFAKYISDRITGAIDKLRIDVIASMDKRVTILEVLAGIKRTKED